MSKTVTFPSHESIDYRALYQRVNDLETKFIGYVKMPYEVPNGFFVANLSTRLTKQENITLTLLG